MDTNVTALTVLQRASLALGSSEHETRLKELAVKHVGITAITNTAGYQDAQSARMELKNTRVDLTHKAKAARDDANAFSGAVIIEEKRLIDIIRPEEERLGTLQQAWDDKIEADRLAALKAAEDRKQALRMKVSEIHEMGLMVGKPSAGIAEQLAIVEGLVIADADYAEFANDARNVRQVTITSLTKLLDATRAQEAEAVRVAAERVELEKLRKEKAERDAKDAEERAATLAALTIAPVTPSVVEMPATVVVADPVSVISQATIRASFDDPDAVRAAIHDELDDMSHMDLLLTLDAIRYIKTGVELKRAAA